MGRPKKTDKQKKDKKNGKDKDEVAKPISGLAQETKNSLWAIFGFAFAVVSTLALFHHAGVAGDYFANFASSLFGWGVFLIPVSSVLIGTSFIKSVSKSVQTSVLIGVTLFILSFLAIFYTLGGTETAARISHGGYLGLILGYPLSGLVGQVATMIILVVMVGASIMVMLDTPIHSILGIKKPSEVLPGDDRPLQDKVVIKRGNEIVDVRAEEAKAKLQATTAVAKVSAKPVDEEREFVIKASKSGVWAMPPLDILATDKEKPHAGDINASVGIIKRTLSNFGIDVEMGEVSIGPTVTQFTLRPAVGIKLSKITTLRPDLSLALAAHPIRIEAPIPGKSLVGIEVPNKKSSMVGLRDLIDTDQFKTSKYFLPISLGRDVAGFPVFAGIDKMPHLLVAGATGTGKSVTINTLLLSLLYKHSPDMLKLILVDPKRVELTLYNGIPHLITPVITDPKKVVNALKWAVREMDKRYDRLSLVHARDILSFNEQQASKKQELMPYIVVVIDELADIMASYGRDVEVAIVRLAQMSRAVGIHLVVSTQRPSVEVITGLIKANITSRIALQVASQIDSRTILDMSGAESLLGHGDMLYLAGDSALPRRVQGAFVSEKEVKDVVKFWKQQADQMEEDEPKESELAIDLDQPVSAGGDMTGGGDDGGDELYEAAKEVVAQAGKASASLLQRRLSVGYARAARLLDILEENGIIGPGHGAKPREVYIGQAAQPKPDNFVDDGSTAQLASALDQPASPSQEMDEQYSDKIANEE